MSTLPLTHLIVDQLTKQRQKENLTIVHVNHASPTIYAMNELLMAAGCDVIPVYVDYRAGTYDSPAGLSHEILSALSEAQARNSRTVLLEDGGHGSFMATNSAIQPPSFAVEQTMRGHRRALNHWSQKRLRHPIISVARSKIKTRLETPALAVRIGDELSSFLTMAGTSLIGASVRVVGFGVLGRAVAWRCREAYGCRVVVVERHPAVLELAKSEGFDCAEHDDWTDSRSETVLIGATGTDVMREGVQLADLPGRLFLCSVSSVDIEFRSLLSFLRSRYSNIRQGPWGTHFRVDSNHDIYAIADGWPVNFYRSDGVSLPLPFGDLIMARMASGIFAGLGALEDLKPAVYRLGDEFWPAVDGMSGLVTLWRELHGLDATFIWPPVSPHGVAEGIADADMSIRLEMESTWPR